MTQFATVIGPRSSLTIERRRKVSFDMRGDATVQAVLTPTDRGREYITVVIGDVKIGTPITPSDVVGAMRNLLDPDG